MLEIICAASLALSANLNNYQSDLAFNEKIEISELNHIYLAKGKPHESRYRREADRTQREFESQNRSQHGTYRNSDLYRQEAEYRRDRQDRVYQNRDRYHREVEYDRDRDRYYPGEHYRNEYLRRNRYHRY